ncbi:hypothetical protein CsSME_00043814 [Camellia sinensis var. sinensis]
MAIEQNMQMRNKAKVTTTGGSGSQPSMGTKAKTANARPIGSQPSIDTRAKTTTARPNGNQPSMGTKARATVAKGISSQLSMGNKANAALVRASGSQPTMANKANARPSIEPCMPIMVRSTPPPGFSCISTTQSSTSAPTNSFMFRGRRFVSLSPQKQAATSATNNKNAN